MSRSVSELGSDVFAARAAPGASGNTGVDVWLPGPAAVRVHPTSGVSGVIVTVAVDRAPTASEIV